MRQRLRRLAADTRGATVIEFAFLLPIFALFLLGMIDTTQGAIARYSLEQAAQDAIEQVSLGNRNRTDAESVTRLRTRGAAIAGVPVGQVAANQWLECRPATGTGRRGPLAITETCAETEIPTRYIEIVIWKRFTPFFNYSPFAVAGSAAGDGSYRVQGEAAVRVQ